MPPATGHVLHKPGMTYTVSASVQWSVVSGDTSDGAIEDGAIEDGASGQPRKRWYPRSCRGDVLPAP